MPAWAGTGGRKSMTCRWPVLMRVSDRSSKSTRTRAHSSQQTNTTNDETFNINNLGDADLDWNIYEDAAFPAIPASDGNFPRGPYAVSAGAPPAAANAPVSKGPGLNALLGSMVYGTETQTNNFDGFDLDVPEVLTPVAPYVWTTFPGAGAMDDGTDNVYFFDGQVAYEANVMTVSSPRWAPVAGFAQDPSGMSQDPNTGVFYVVTTNVSTSILYTVDFRQSDGDTGGYGDQCAGGDRVSVHGCR